MILLHERCINLFELIRANFFQLLSELELFQVLSQALQGFTLSLFALRTLTIIILRLSAYNLHLLVHSSLHPLKFKFILFDFLIVPALFSSQYLLLNLPPFCLFLNLSNFNYYHFIGYLFKNSFLRVDFVIIVVKPKVTYILKS